MELTKEQQDIIEKAAVDYGDKLKAEGKQASFAGVWYAAMDFALSSPDLMRGVLEEFGQWLWKNYTQVDAQVWEGRRAQRGIVYTINQLIDIFLTDKNKEDDRAANNSKS